MLANGIADLRADRLVALPTAHGVAVPSRSISGENNTLDGDGGRILVLGVGQRRGGSERKKRENNDGCFVGRHVVKRANKKERRRAWEVGKTEKDKEREN